MKMSKLTVGEKRALKNRRSQLNVTCAVNIMNWRKGKYRVEDVETASARFLALLKVGAR